MKITASIAFVFFGLVLSHAQNNWMPASIPHIPYNVVWLRQMYTDTILDELYICGGIYNDNGDSTYVLKYSPASNLWSIVKTFDVNAVRCIIMYHNKLILDGNWMYDGNNWTQIGGNLDGSVYNMKIFNDTLYVMGIFTKIGNINAHCIARWDGTSWSSMKDFTVTDPGIDYVADLEFFQNKWYVSGNFDIPSESGRCIAVYENGGWHIAGGGILGSFAEATKLKVYKSELYVAGMIWKSAGNTGHLIQRWNGYQWSEAGSGLQDAFNTYSNGQVNDMIVYHDELYVCGGFNYAGHIPARVAKWDGVQWCSLGGDFHNKKIGLLGILRDTLFIGFGGKYVDSIYVKHLTKWIGGDFVDTCSGVAKGMNEEVQQPSLILYPNPATSSFTVAGSYALPATLRLYDLTGRQALGAELHSNRQQVDVGQLSQGMYLLRLLSSSGTTIRKLIIR